MPSARLQVADKGLDGQWVVQSNGTDASCPGARRFAFVAGYAPPYQPCVYANPDPAPSDQMQDGQQDQPPPDEQHGWRDFFGLGHRNDPARQAPPPPPPPEPAEQP